MVIDLKKKWVNIIFNKFPVCIKNLFWSKILGYQRHPKPKLINLAKVICMNVTPTYGCWTWVSLTTSGASHQPSGLKILLFSFIYFRYSLFQAQNNNGSIFWNNSFLYSSSLWFFFSHTLSTSSLEGYFQSCFFLPSLGKFSSYTIIVTKMIFKQNSTREGVCIGLREKVPTELGAEWNFSLLWSLVRGRASVR